MRAQIPTAREQVLLEWQNAFKIMLLFSLLMMTFVIMNHVATSWSFFAAFIMSLCAIFASMLMLGMAILAHDGVHRVLFKNALVNDLVSGLLSALGGGVPFYANRQYHLTHHSYTHQGPDDPEHTMHHPSFLYAFFIGSFIGLVIQYQLMFTNLMKGFRSPHHMGRALKDLCFIAAALWFYTKGLMLLGLSPLLTIVPAMLVFPFAFSFRALSDHYGLPRVKRKSERYREVLENSEEENESIVRNAGQQVSGWVVITQPWLEWLWSSVNYHEVHHKFPYLSHVYLKQAYEATRNDYPYREVKGYIRSLFDLKSKHYYDGE